MALSLRCKSLEKRLKELRKHLLPRNFSATGAYSDKALDQARAYRLLVHAEIESFLEDIAQQTLISKMQDWIQAKKASHSLICLLACYHSGWQTEEIGSESKSIVPERSSLSGVVHTAEKVIENACNQYMHRLRINHGIRQDNLKQIIVPIGVRIDELDSTWVTNLDEFGKKRGDTAHNTYAVQKSIDPKTELDSVEDLLVGLKKLDQIIAQL